MLKQGTNSIYIIATPVHKVKDWDVINSNPGIIQVVTPAEPWKRKLFNGYAQIIVQREGSSKEIILSATAKNVKPAALTIILK